MGIVPQDPYLFSTTIKDNIRYGRPESTDEEVVKAATAVGAHEFITKLENGYDTLLQERGGIDADEMTRVFNMGVGFVLIVRPAFADSVERQLKQLGEDAFVIGRVVKGTGEVYLD